MSTKETFYDEHIAPVLLRLCKLAEANGISFVAMVEWQPGETGRTHCLQAEAGFSVRLADAAVCSLGNVDSLLIAVERWARAHGHNSMYLAQLGVPLRPEGTAIQ